MDTSFRLFPESASSVSSRVDALYLFLVGVTVFFTLLICALILYFGIKYRHGSKASRGKPPTSYLLEVTWIVVPLALTMVMFYWGARLYFDIKTPPADALLIDVVAKQWMWKLQHPEGKTEINTLHLPVGQPVKLRMISQDVIHSFYVPAFRVKQDVLPGYYTELWFEPTRVGEYHLFCAEYCGTEHSLMRGRIVVQEPTDYAAWIAKEPGEPAAIAGERLFGRFQCATCHKPEGGGTGPTLVGLFGSRVPLAGGGTVLADEQYLRDSILNPRKHLVAGYQALMPQIADVTETDALLLIAYLKSLPANQTN